MRRSDQSKRSPRACTELCWSCATSSRRLRTPTLSNTDFRWSWTVCSEMCSWAASADVERPRVTCRTSSASRAVSSCVRARSGSTSGAGASSIVTANPSGTSGPDRYVARTLSQTPDRARTRAQGGATAGSAPDRSRAATACTTAGSSRYLAGPLVRDGVAVTIEEAPAPEVLPLITRTQQLTAREAELVRHVTRGLSTSALAAQLHISEHTVQDHLKSVFDKVGVRSRREPVAGPHPTP